MVQKHGIAQFSFNLTPSMINVYKISIYIDIFDITDVAKPCNYTDFALMDSYCVSVHKRSTYLFIIDISDGPEEWNSTAFALFDISCD